MPAWVASLREVLQIIAFLVAIVGFPLALQKYLDEKRKDRLAREKEAFGVSNQRYVEYLRLCLQYPDLDGFDLSKDDAGVQRAGVNHQRLILYSALTAMLETAYLYYAAGSTHLLGEQWSAWERYFRLWAERKDYRTAWPLLRGQFHDQFSQYMDGLVKVA